MKVFANKVKARNSFKSITNQFGTFATLNEAIKRACKSRFQLHYAKFANIDSLLTLLRHFPTLIQPVAHASSLPSLPSISLLFYVLLLLLSLANIVCLPAVNETISLEPKFERQTTRRAAPSTYFFLTPCQTIAATPIVNITTPSASPPNSSSSLTLTLMRVFGIELRATLYAARQRKSITVGIQSGNTLTTA